MDGTIFNQVNKTFYSCNFVVLKVSRYNHQARNIELKRIWSGIDVNSFKNVCSAFVIVCLGRV